MKKFITVLLTLAMLLSFAACAKNGDSTETSGAATAAPSVSLPPDTSDTENNNENDDNPVFEPTVLELLKDGKTDFAIIYPNNASDSEIDIALKLKSSFEQYTGADIVCKPDFVLDASVDTSASFEILVGSTNRKESADVLALVEASKDYAVAACGNKLVIAGNSISATLNGAYYFINQFLSVTKIEDGSLKFSSEQNYYYKAVYPVENFSVLGNKAKDYRIVIPANADFGVERFALRVKYLIAVRTGYSFEIVNDQNTASEYELLIGKTARTTASVGDNEYAIVAKGNRVELLGGGLYDYEYMYNYCANKLCALIRDAKADAGELYRKSTVDDIKESAIESVLNKDGELRFMQFNILGEDGHHPFSLPSRMIAAMIDELQPDIVAIEEYTAVAQSSKNYPLEKSLAELGYKMAYGGKMYSGGLKPATPIFYKSDVFELVYEDTYNPTQGHSGKYTTSAVLKRLSDGKLIGIVNCHLAHETTAAGDALRVVQIKEAIDTAMAMQARYSCDILLTGDLNSKTSGGAYTTLIQRGFVNTHDLAKVSDDHTTAWRDDPVYNENGGFMEHPKEEAYDFMTTAIDHTLHLGNGLSFNRFDVLTDTCSLSVSDHAATVIDFDMGTYTAPEPTDPFVGDWTYNY